MANTKQFDIYQLIGKNIQKYRQAKGLTQAQLADKVFMSSNFISKLESNTEQSISIDSMLIIARSLEIDIRNLFDDVEKLK